MEPTHGYPYLAHACAFTWPFPHDGFGRSARFSEGKSQHGRTGSRRRERGAATIRLLSALTAVTGGTASAQDGPPSAELQGRVDAAVRRLLAAQMEREAALAKASDDIEVRFSEASLEVAAGGTADDSDGFFVRPTVLLGTDPEHEVFTTEYFGPVLGVIHAETLEEAVRIQNGTAFGLTAGLHSLEPAEVEQETAELKHDLTAQATERL